MNSNTTPVPIKRAGTLALLSAGGQAFKAVPGLRWLLIKGFLLLYGIFAGLGVAVTWAVYVWVVQPLLSWAGNGGENAGWWADLLNVIVVFLTTLVEAVLLGASLLLSFVLALVLMSVWFETIAERILRHKRGQAVSEAGFPIGAWLGSLGTALRDGLWLVLLAIASLGLGFIPVLGPFLVFAITCYVLGWEVREPYISVRAGMGDDLRNLRKGLNFWTLRVGALPAVLALIPVVGWALLPLVMTRLVAGVAWSSEEGTTADSPSGS